MAKEILGIKVVEWCYKRVTLPDNSETYCYLTAGHEGKCEPGIKLVMKPEVCGHVNQKTGMKCGLPKDPPHTYHSDGMRGWDTLPHL